MHSWKAAHHARVEEILRKKGFVGGGWSTVVHWCATVLPFRRPDEARAWSERHAQRTFFF